MKLIKAMHHVSLKCTSAEYDKVVDFYHRILGIDIARTWENGVMFDVGNALIEVFRNGTDSLEKGTIRHFALATDDVDACVERVTSEGYEVFMGPKEIVIPSEKEFKARMAFCYGPLGEEIEFFQER